jgi:hypothetical protein
VDIGNLEEDYSPERDSIYLTFEILKKNGIIRVVTDFRKLKLLLKHLPFPFPKIWYTPRSMEWLTFVTKLDLNMGYYHIELDADAQKLLAE